MAWLQVMILSSSLQSSLTGVWLVTAHMRKHILNPDGLPQAGGPGESDKGGMATIEALRGCFSSAVSSALEDADTGSKDLLSSIDRSLQLDHEACGNLDSMIVPCCEDLRELNSGHHHKIVEITEDAGKCLLEEYMVNL